MIHEEFVSPGCTLAVRTTSFLFTMEMELSTAEDEVMVTRGMPCCPVTVAPRESTRNRISESHFDSRFFKSSCDLKTGLGLKIGEACLFYRYHINHTNKVE